MLFDIGYDLQGKLLNLRNGAVGYLLFACFCNKSVLKPTPLRIYQDKHLFSDVK